MLIRQESEDDPGLAQGRFQHGRLRPPLKEPAAGPLAQ